MQEEDKILVFEENILVKISHEKMKAYLTLNFTENNKILPEHIFSKLEMASVLHGVNLEKIHYLCRFRQSVKDEVIAQGLPPKAGKDAEIISIFKKPEPVPKLIEDENKVNYYELGQIIQVDEGQLLIKRTPPTSGETGMTVTGQAIPAIPGKNKNFSVGKGVKIEGDKVLAAFQGALSWQGEKVSVTKLLVVPGDVDFAVGNISFQGKVLIMGFVREGFSVEAEEDIEIRQGVEGASVTSHNGSVIINGGILGANKAFIKAKKNVEARFIQQATIKAKNIIVNEYILKSKIVADEAVLIQGSKGKILGENEIIAKTKIQANSIKSAKGLELKVEGFDRKIYYKKIKEINEVMEEADKRLRSLAVKARLLSSKKDAPSIEQLKEVLPLYMKVIEEIDELKSEQQSLIYILKNTKGEGMIEIKKEADEGVSFFIKCESVCIERPLNYITLYFDQDEKKIVFFE